LVGLPFSAIRGIAMHFEFVPVERQWRGTSARGAVKELLLGEETGVFPPLFGHREE
jgi:hypothetical protein